MVKFLVLPASASAINHSNGSMSETTQYYAAIAAQSNNLFFRQHSTSRCIGYVSSSSGSTAMEASYVSMDDDGFTINVNSTNTTFDIAYEAYA